MSGLALKDDQFCFICGSRNTDGLQIQFDYPEKGRCRSELVLPPKFQGWQGIVHGGIISALLDESFAHAVGGPRRSAAGYGAVTAEMTVKFKKPAGIGKRLLLEGRVVGEKGRLVEVESELKDEAGSVLASATGKLIKVKTP